MDQSTTMHIHINMKAVLKDVVALKEFLCKDQRHYSNMLIWKQDISYACLVKSA